MSGPAVVLYPDPRLRVPAAPVETFDAGLAHDVQRLTTALASIPAIGLAGPHLGIARRIVAIDLAATGGGRAPEVYVNPRVVAASAETAIFEEGSVSLPGILERMSRPERIRIAWSTPDGEAREGNATGFLAACLQHEIDQCDGIFWLERLSRLRRERALARWAKQARAASRGP